MKHLEPLIKELATYINNDFQRTSPYLINISGCMGAGKSTYAQLLKQELSTTRQVTHISEDDFLQPRMFRDDLQQIVYTDGEFAGKTHWEVHENWLRLDLMKQTILNLSHNKSITYHPYQRETGTFSAEKKVIEPAEIIVFETSIFSELFTTVILIEVANEILLKRKLGRDSDLRDREKITTYHTVAQYPFWLRHKPAHPHFIINNNDMEHPVLTIQ